MMQVMSDADKDGETVAGTVKWFDPTKGFGFVVADGGGPDILLHANVLRNFGQSSVADAAGIEIVVQETARGIQAVEVLRIDPPAGDESADRRASLDDAIALAKKANRKLSRLLGLPELLRAAKNHERVVPPCQFDGTDLARLAGPADVCGSCRPFPKPFSTRVYPLGWCKSETIPSLIGACRGG